MIISGHVSLYVQPLKNPFSHFSKIMKNTVHVDMMLSPEVLILRPPGTGAVLVDGGQGPVMNGVGVGGGDKGHGLDLRLILGLLLLLLMGRGHHDVGMGRLIRHVRGVSPGAGIAPLGRVGRGRWRGLEQAHRHCRQLLIFHHLVGLKFFAFFGLEFQKKKELFLLNKKIPTISHRRGI